jgi:hypothetical protein
MNVAQVAGVAEMLVAISRGSDLIVLEGKSLPFHSCFDLNQREQ